MDFVSLNNGVIDEKITIHFLLPNNSYVISIDSTLQESVTDLRRKFF